MFDRTPHQRWCMCCTGWIYCACWRDEDHETPFELTPVRFPRSERARARALRRARDRERTARNVYAWRAAWARRQADALIHADEHAHVRERHGLVEWPEMPSTWLPEAF